MTALVGSAFDALRHAGLLALAIGALLMFPGLVLLIAVLARPRPKG